MKPLNLSARRPALVPFLACLALAGSTGALAQSSVGIYGIIDQGVTKANDSTTPAGSMPGRVAGSAWNVKAGNTSRARTLTVTVKR